jgi:hypothetical protein
MSDMDETIRALEARITELESERATKNRVGLPRPRISRRATVVGVLLAVLLPGAALASHQFPDVLDGNPFHDDIAAIAGAGVTAGFGDGGFHPAANVTRQAMAAFLHRIGGRAALAVSFAPITPSLTVNAGVTSTTFVPVRQVTITVPGTTNPFSPQQLVHIQGHVEFTTSMSTSLQGCPCEFGAIVRDTTTENFSTSQLQTFESTSSTNFSRGFDVEVLLAAEPGERTYELQVWLNGRNSAASAATFGLDSRSTLSAVTVPFGPDGTSSL